MLFWDFLRLLHTNFFVGEDELRYKKKFVKYILTMILNQIGCISDRETRQNKNR